MKRGSIKRAECVMIGVWIPREMEAALDIAIRHEDSDRSKFVRKAIRERVLSLGLGSTGGPGR